MSDPREDLGAPWQLEKALDRDFLARLDELRRQAVPLIDPTEITYKGTYPLCSTSFHADNVNSLAYRCRAAITAGDALLAAELAYRLGQEATALHLEVPLRRNAAQAAGSRRGAAVTGSVERAALAVKWLDEDDALALERGDPPGKGMHARAKILAARHGEPISTMRGALWRESKRRDESS